MANCGWPWLCSASSAIVDQVASSRSVSRPGSTSAPCGSFAMVASSSAVAGIEPVEPAAITGPDVVREPRRLGRDQRVAALGRLHAALLGEDSAASCVRMNFRKSSVSSQYLSNSSGTRSSSRLPAHLTRRHVVHQPRQILRQRERGGRIVGDQRRVAALRAARWFPPNAGSRPRAAWRGRARSAPPAAPARLRRVRQWRLARRRSRPRRSRRSRRCAARSRRRPRACRGRRRGRGGRRAGSADRAWRGQAPADRASPESRARVCRRAAHRSAPAETAPRRGC